MDIIFFNFIIFSCILFFIATALFINIELEMLELVKENNKIKEKLNNVLNSRDIK